MSSENYGVSGELVQSVASTPVSTDTNVIFIGACASGDLNKPYIITSFSDYATKLGGAKGDGYNLTEAALAAFSVANINKVIMIPVSHSTTLTAADYVGDASALTGVYAIEAMLAKQPTAVNLICAPGISDSTVLSAIKDICIKADGHWASYMVYDVAKAADQVNASGVAQVAAIVNAKSLAHEQASAVWGDVKIDGNYVVSGAAVRACLMAKSDAGFGVPARTGGNLNVPGMLDLVSSGASVVLKEVDATSLSADGICSFVNYSGSFYTWGDHTSAFASGTVADERARFDNSIRMLLMITNRFQMKYRTSIDDPMTLQMRNDVINEELDFLASLVAIGALIGEPVCEFSAIDNPVDNLAQGQFTWRIAATPTLPFKYGNVKVAYSQAGLSVYIA